MPTSIFGPHQDDFYPLLGRIIALGSVIDRQLRDLVNHYVIEPGKDVGNMSTYDVLKKAKQFCDDIEEEENKDEMLRYLCAAQRATNRRNLYAHQLFPAVSIETGTEVSTWGTKKYSEELRLGENLEVMKEDVLIFSALIIHWRDTIQPLAALVFSKR